MNGKNMKGFPASGPFIESIFEDDYLADGLYAEVYVPAEGNKRRLPRLSATQLLS